MSLINEGATSYLRFPVILAHFILWEKLGLEAEEVVGGSTFLFFSSWTSWRDKPKIFSDKGEDSKESFKDSLTEDFSTKSLLLEKVKLPRVPLKEVVIPIAWSTWSKKDLSSEKSSPLSWIKDPAADRKCSAVSSAWEVLLWRFSDLDQRDRVSLNPSTDLEPRREALVLSQVGADFPCISKFLLLSRTGKEEGPKPETFPVLLLE